MQNIDVFGLFNVDVLYVILGMAAIIILLIVLQIINLRKIKIMKLKYDGFMSGKDALSLEDMIQTKFAEIDQLQKTTKKNSRQISEIKEELLSTYKKIGIVKYDAFNEMGGKLSFALAMLDKSDNGFVINAMHSREGCYTYIKEIVKGESYITLGDEEKQALDNALNSNRTDN